MGMQNIVKCKKWETIGKMPCSCTKLGALLQPPLREQCTVIRPLLTLTRFETGKFCTFWQLPIYPDVSNEKMQFFRNRIRKQLLPAVKLFFNPQIENILLQFAGIVEAENWYMNHIVHHLLQRFVQRATNPLVECSPPRGAAVGAVLHKGLATVPVQCNWSCYCSLTTPACVPPRRVTKPPLFPLKQTQCEALPHKRPDPPLRSAKIIVKKPFKAAIGSGSSSVEWDLACVHGISITCDLDGSAVDTARSTYFPHQRSTNPLPTIFLPCTFYNTYKFYFKGIEEYVRSNQASFGEKAPLREYKHTIKHTKEVLFQRHSSSLQPDSNTVYPPKVFKLGLKGRNSEGRDLTGCVQVAECTQLEGYTHCYRFCNQSKVVRTLLFSQFSRPKKAAFWLWNRRLPAAEQRLPYTANSPCLKKTTARSNSSHGDLKGVGETIFYKALDKCVNNGVTRVRGKQLHDPYCPRLQNLERFGKAICVAWERTGGCQPKGTALGNCVKEQVWRKESLGRKCSYNNRMNTLFINSFVAHFDSLELDKREAYWPILVPFFPKALQRRVVKLFLLNQNWKTISYSQIENFLATKC